MFACMVEVHDLNRAGKMPVGEIPDPVRAIAHDNSGRGPVPTPVVGLRIDPEPEVFGSLDSADIGGGTLVAQRPALIIDTGLCKHASQFAFSGARRLAWCSTRAAFGLGRDYKNLRSIHLHVQMRDRSASHRWQTELFGTSDVLLLSALNVGSDRFSRPLDGFGRHFQVCQELELYAAWSKRGLTADGCQHAPYAWREIRLVDVELNVGGKLSLVARGTEIVGTVDPCPTDSRKYWAGTHSYIW